MVSLFPVVIPALAKRLRLRRSAKTGILTNNASRTAGVFNCSVGTISQVKRYSLIKEAKSAPIPKSKPVEHSEKDKERIASAFSSIMIPQGFGSQAERARAEIKQWYALKREIDRVFNKLIDIEVLKQRHNSNTI